MFKYYQDVYRLQAAVHSAFDSRARSEKYSLLQSIALLMSQGVTNNPKRTLVHPKKIHWPNILFTYMYISYLYMHVSLCTTLKTSLGFLFGAYWPILEASRSMWPQPGLMSWCASTNFPRGGCRFGRWIAYSKDIWEWEEMGGLVLKRMFVNKVKMWLGTTLGPQNHEQWRFYIPNMGYNP